MDYKFEMAMNMDSDSEVIFKEKPQAKEIKEEEAAKDASTIRFDFRASTPTTLPAGEGRKDDRPRHEARIPGGFK